MVIVFIDELSLDILAAMSKLVALSCWVTIWNNYYYPFLLATIERDAPETYKLHGRLLSQIIPIEIILLAVKGIQEVPHHPVRAINDATWNIHAVPLAKLLVRDHHPVAQLDGGKDAGEAGIDHLRDLVETNGEALQFPTGFHGAKGVDCARWDAVARIVVEVDFSQLHSD